MAQQTRHALRGGLHWTCAVLLVCALVAAGGWPGAAGGQEATDWPPAIEAPAAVAKTPAGAGQVTGAALREGGARDVDGAVGDLGARTDVNTAAIATAVPSVWGLADFSSYLVVIDGVPWGGAFTPAISRVNLADVESIEIQTAGAAVLYGTTSFTGIVHVNRYAPEATPAVFRASVGSYGSGALGWSGALPAVGGYSQSLSVDVNRDNLSGVDHGLTDAHALYRAAASVAGGWLRFDAEIESETRLPESPVLRLGTVLAPTPLDANYQPADARVGAHRVQAGLDFRHDSAAGPLEAVFSYAQSRVADRRGFLAAFFIDDGLPNADGFNQERSIRALYADVHARTTLGPRWAVGWGVDWMGGRAAHSSQNFAYYVPLDGSQRAPPTSALPIDGTVGFSDFRSDFGLYGQFDWVRDPATTASLSLRLSHNSEERSSASAAGQRETGPTLESESTTLTRLSFGIAVTHRLGGADSGGPELKLSFRDTSPPPTPDFGPQYSPHLLKPMEGRRSDASLRGTAAGDRLEWGISAGYLDIRHLIVAQTDQYGDPVLANAGSAYLRSLDIDARWHVAAVEGLVAAASGGLHRASFGGTQTIEAGQPTELAGHDLALAARQVAAASLAYESGSGVQAQLSANYVGPRYLDRLNTARIGGYVTMDVKVGLRSDRGGVWLRGTNLTGRRDPIAESEFGDQAFYLNPARTISLEAYINCR
jgi:iron complex outermembrane recepter protein